MKLTLLGTSASIPTKDRNPASYFLSYKNQGLLFDCAEGTQRQMKKAGLKLSKITKIFLTHWHGDHVLGLGGLLQTVSDLEYSSELEVYGPKGSQKYFEHLFKSLTFTLGVPLKIIEVETGLVFENSDFRIDCLPMKHKNKCLAYSFIEKDTRKINMTKVNKLGIPEGPLLGKIQRGQSITYKGTKILPDEVSSMKKGKKFTYITDTLINKNCYEIARDSDLLLCEAVFEEKLSSKALEHSHLTAKQAGQIASMSNSKKLVITHFSARYKDSSILLEEASEIFPNVVAGEDFMKINI